MYCETFNTDTTKLWTTYKQVAGFSLLSSCLFNRSYALSVPHIYTLPLDTADKTGIFKLRFWYKNYEQIQKFVLQICTYNFSSSKYTLLYIYMADKDHFQLSYAVSKVQQTTKVYLYYSGKEFCL
jgi:hypothetical protein